MKQPPKSTTFETAMQKIEEIARQLDNGALSLEDSLRAFEEAVAYIRFCEDALRKAEQKVSVLKEQAEGTSPEEEPVHADDQ